MDELAGQYGFTYEVAKADIDEKAIRHDDARRLVRRAGGRAAYCGWPGGVRRGRDPSTRMRLRPQLRSCQSLRRLGVAFTPFFVNLCRC